MFESHGEFGGKNRTQIQMMPELLRWVLDFLVKTLATTIR